MKSRSVNPASAGSRRGQETALWTVVFLTLAASVGYLVRVDVTVIAPSLAAEFHLSQVQLGKIFSAFLLGYTLFQIPSGGLADRVPARWLFLAMTLAWSLITAATAGAAWLGRLSGFGAFWALCLLRGALGICAAPTYPAAGRTVALSVSPHWQGRANGAVLASIGIGSATAPLLLGFFSQHWGWRVALFAAAGLAGSTAVVWGLRASTGAVAGRRPAFAASQPAASWPSPLKKPGFWFLAASYTLQGYVGYVFIFWFYLYLVNVRHFDLMKAAWLTTLPWVSSLAATPLGGGLSDWAVGRWGRTTGRRAVPIAAFILSAGFLVLGARTGSAALAVLSLTLSTALVLSTEGPFWSSMNQISGPHSGIGGGVMNFGSNLGGWVSPWLTPWLAARLGWSTALSMTAVVTVLAALLWMRVEIPRASPE